MTESREMKLYTQSEIGSKEYKMRAHPCDIVLQATLLTSQSFKVHLSISDFPPYPPEVNPVQNAFNSHDSGFCCWRGPCIAS